MKYEVKISHSFCLRFVSVNKWRISKKNGCIAHVSHKIDFRCGFRSSQVCVELNLTLLTQLLCHSLKHFSEPDIITITYDMFKYVYVLVFTSRYSHSLSSNHPSLFLRFFGFIWNFPFTTIENKKNRLSE